MFKTYEEARAHAQAQADRYGFDHGLRRVDGPLVKGWRVVMLPSPRFRSGAELACEVVTPSQAQEA